MIPGVLIEPAARRPVLPSGHATSILEVRRIEPAKRLDAIAVERRGRRRVRAMAGRLRDVNLARISRMPIGSCSPRHAGGAEDMDVADEEAFSTGVAKCRSSTDTDRQFEPSCRPFSRSNAIFLTSDGTSMHVRMATTNERAIKSIYMAAGWDLAALPPDPGSARGHAVDAGRWPCPRHEAFEAPQDFAVDHRGQIML